MKLQDAAKLVGLEQPIQVLDASEQIPHGATLGMYDGIRDGVHTLLISVENIAWKSWITGEDFDQVEAQVIFHEATHALQVERDYAGDYEAMMAATLEILEKKFEVSTPDELGEKFEHLDDDREAYEKYASSPWEVEARENAARFAGETIEPD